MMCTLTHGKQINAKKHHTSQASEATKSNAYGEFGKKETSYVFRISPAVALEN